MADAQSQALQQTLKDLSRAFSDAFDKFKPNKFPVINKRGKNRENYRYPQECSYQQ